MGKVTMNWLITGHSGRACKADAVYTKINKVTGKVTSSKLCHPYEGEASELQVKQRTRFGKVASACQTLIRDGADLEQPEYEEALAGYKSQHKCGSLLGYMMQKITDTRPGKTEPEYRAVVKGWVSDPQA